MTFHLKPPPQEWQNQELGAVRLNLRPRVSRPRSVQSPGRLFSGIAWASSCLNQTIRQCCIFFSEPRNATAHQLWTNSGVWCGAEQLDMVCKEERRQICYSLCSVDKYLAVQVKERPNIKILAKLFFSKIYVISPWSYSTVSAPLPATFQSNFFLPHGHDIIHTRFHCVSPETSRNSVNCNKIKRNQSSCCRSQPSLEMPGARDKWWSCHHYAQQFTRACRSKSSVKDGASEGELANWFIWTLSRAWCSCLIN